MWLLTVSTVLEELATADLFTVALDVTTGDSRAGAAAPVTTTESSKAGEDARRPQLLLLDTLLQLTLTAPRSMR